MNTSTPAELIAEADRLTTLGIKHHKALRLNESEDLRRQALAVLEQALGPEDPGIAEKLNDLAWVLSRNGKHEEAERVLRRSLAFLDQPHHPRQRTVLTTLGHLAKYADEQGRVIDVERMYQTLLTVRRQVLGSKHPSVMRLQEWLLMSKMTHHDLPRRRSHSAISTSSETEF